jgi:hypothetical protein
MVPATPEDCPLPFWEGAFFHSLRNQRLIIWATYGIPPVLRSKTVREINHSVVGLIEDLEAEFPPRCKQPGESLEDHMVYAGRVALTQDLRARYEAGMKKAKKGLPTVLN